MPKESAQGMMPESVRTLQIFNVYQQYGGEEALVRSLSAIMQGPAWKDLYFESADWAREPASAKVTQPLRAFWNRAAVHRLREAHLEHRPDVWLLHNVLPVGSLGIYREALRLGVPVIQYLHNYRPFSTNGVAWHNGAVMDKGLHRIFWPEIMAGSYRGSRLQTLLMAALLQTYFGAGLDRGVTTWLSQSHFQKEKYISAGVPSSTIEVLLPPRASAPAPTDWREDDYVLFLGRLVPEKGIAFLFDQWERAESSGEPTMPRLIVAGAGPMESYVRARAQTLTRVSYVGHVQAAQRRELIAGCKAVVVPSLCWEVLGLVVFEAYEMEKPVLASDIGGLGEIVFDGTTGFKFGANDAASFAQALSKLQQLGTPERRELGQRGRHWLAEATNVEKWKLAYSGLARRTIARHATSAKARTRG
jgi:glycosyltransferase involved in cell wall biosynthesis